MNKPFFGQKLLINLKFGVVMKYIISFLFRGPIKLGIKRNIFRYLFFFAITSFLILASLNNRIKSCDAEKNSDYECWFKPFESGILEFFIKFYLLAIFDLEMEFLFPGAVGFRYVGKLGLLSIMLFLLILTLSFLFALKKEQ